MVEQWFNDGLLTTVDTSYILTVRGDAPVYTSIQKWGNSQAVRIPKSILEMADLNENDRVEIKVQGRNLIIIPVKKHKSLEERIAEYQGDYYCREWDTGKPAGKEVL